MESNFVISQNDWDTIIAYAQMSYDKWKTEIGGMCVAILDKETKTMVIKDPVIGKQEVSSTLCTLDKGWLADYYMEMAMKHGTDVRFVWWHSHHMMGVQWSGTDTSTMKEGSNGDYSMSLVVNLKGEHTFRVSWWKPMAGHIDTKVKIAGPEFSVTKKMEDNFNNLVTKEARAIVKTTTHNNRYNGYHDWRTKYKQPGNYGPGYVDAELMDKTESLQEKYCNTMDSLMEQAFTDQLKWPQFMKKWDKIIEDAGAHNIIIEPFEKDDYSDILLKGLIPDATGYFESPEPGLFLYRDRGIGGYGDPLQKNLWDV